MHKPNYFIVRESKPLKNNNLQQVYNQVFQDSASKMCLIEAIEKYVNSLDQNKPIYKKLVKKLVWCKNTYPKGVPVKSLQTLSDKLEISIVIRLPFEDFGNIIDINPMTKK